MVKVVAFIPVRVGSKSIPLKNVKPFCGKPLVYWNVVALNECKAVDEIVVATDSEKIEKIVEGFNLDKVTLYKRLEENATDTSSTESVMLEYITQSNLKENDVFILVQATSPLTQTNDFEKALQMYMTSDYDSILSCVRQYRFYWNEDGCAVNYDYLSRPRRQDFRGTLMENGALYINSVANILKHCNRLSGKIGILEMPEYTGFEIDEPDDWFVLERLMYKHVLSKKSAEIKLFITDVDGVLTDAGMYYSENGDELKKFNTHDGMGFKLLKEAGVKTGIITSEDTQIVARRARKLKLDYLYQGKKHGGKLAAAMEICEQEGISLNNVVYVGDDVNCFELLSHVGYAFCPADAQPKVKNIEGIRQTSAKGGEGVVREVIETLMEDRIIVC